MENEVERLYGMSSEEISILNVSSDKKRPVLSRKTSKTFQIIEEKEKDEQKAIDKISLPS